ncbi:hypothetical protein ACIQTX_14560 [Microbacterium sp. NPDC090281]|uniref:hypothetical protein n=1 Tax=Microbacterium sp. NPDC090281 TaxID=3364208 RepID=UPI00380056FF
MVERYSTEDFDALRIAARGVLVAAHRRITKSVQLVNSDVTEAASTRARALSEVLELGKPSSREGYRALGAVTDRHLTTSIARHWLFMTTDELLAAAVVICSRRGLNLAPVQAAPPPYEHEVGVAQLDLDKPRRGAELRFWPEIVDDEFTELDLGDAEVLKMVEEATQPARDYLALSGSPSDRLLVRWSERASRPMVGLARERTAAWLPEGIVLSFPRLRRSVPGKGVAKEPTDHDATTYLEYVRSDPQALEAVQVEGAKGVEAAHDRARTEVQLKVLNAKDAPEENDALIANCANPAEHPVTGRPCTTGYYSFLDCLGCDNAATVSRLLPAQLATRLVLEALRDSLDTWEVKFASSYYRLCATIERHSRAEIDDAQAHVGDHVPRIMDALKVAVPR